VITPRFVVRRARDLPLFWKVLTPFLVLLLLLGTVGTFVLVRSLADRADESLNRDLAEMSLAARSRVHDRELYVLESATFAANLEGVAESVQARDAAALTALMQSVLALKTDVVLLSVVGAGGETLAQFSRSAARREPRADALTSWAASPLVAPVTGSAEDTTRADLIGFGERPVIAVATTICAGGDACTAVGAVVAGVPAADIVDEARAASGSDGQNGVALYDRGGRLVTASDRAPASADLPDDGRFVRHRISIGGAAAAAVYSPLELQGRRVGWLTVWKPTAHTFEGVRSAAIRLGLVLFAAMLGIVVIGAGLSRFVLAQVRPLVDTNRALAGGDLSARVPVLGRDELGELAEGVNQMANALQDAHATLEARVEERTAQVERLLRERTDFFTAVSHEFRTPLAVILGQAEMLGDPGFEKKAAWQAQASQVLREAAQQLLDFVNDILEIAKAESGRIELRVEDVQVDGVLRRLTPAIQRLAAAGDVRVTVRVPRKLPPIRADESRLRQVVLDLVDNAVKYTPPGGEVGVTAAASGDAIEISVSDTGVGIPADEVDRVFEPFYRVKGTRPQGGQPSSGLGLALVKRLIEAQAGTLRLTSAPGAGTTVTVAVPLAGPRPAAVTPRSGGARAGSDADAVAGDGAASVSR
jgi:signal transduction histidine kinase